MVPPAVMLRDKGKIWSQFEGRNTFDIDEQVVCVCVCVCVVTLLDSWKE